MNWRHFSMNPRQAIMPARQQTINRRDHPPLTDRRHAVPTSRGHVQTTRQPLPLDQQVHTVRQDTIRPPPPIQHTIHQAHPSLNHLPTDKRLSDPTPQHTTLPSPIKSSQHNGIPSPMESLSQRTKAILLNPRYKTEFCRNIDELGVCRYSLKCQFAHHPGELLPKFTHHPHYRTQLCRAYHKAGYCSFGARCIFIHEEREISPPDAKHNPRIIYVNPEYEACCTRDTQHIRRYERHNVTSMRPRRRTNQRRRPRVTNGRYTRSYHRREVSRVCYESRTVTNQNQNHSVQYKVHHTYRTARRDRNDRIRHKEQDRKQREVRVPRGQIRHLNRDLNGTDEHLRNYDTLASRTASQNHLNEIGNQSDHNVRHGINKRLTHMVNNGQPKRGHTNGSYRNVNNNPNHSYTTLHMNYPIPTNNALLPNTAMLTNTALYTDTALHTNTPMFTNTLIHTNPALPRNVTRNPNTTGDPNIGELGIQGYATNTENEIQMTKRSEDSTMYRSTSHTDSVLADNGSYRVSEMYSNGQTCVSTEGSTSFHVSKNQTLSVDNGNYSATNNDNFNLTNIQYRGTNNDCNQSYGLTNNLNCVTNYQDSRTTVQNHGVNVNNYSHFRLTNPNELTDQEYITFNQDYTVTNNQQNITNYQDYNITNTEQNIINYQDSITNNQNYGLVSTNYNWYNISTYFVNYNDMSYCYRM